MLQLDDYANSTQARFIHKKKRKRDAERMLAGSEDIQS